MAFADYGALDRKVSSVCFSPDGKQVASGNGDSTVKIWQTSTGKCQMTFNGHSWYMTTVSYSCLFSNMWCVLNIEDFTGLSRVFVSVQMASR